VKLPTTRIILLPTLLLIILTNPLLIAAIPNSAITHTRSNTVNRTSPLDYDFKLVNETVHVHPNADASVLINYTIEFENYGSDFDYIDIGFPNNYYDLSSVKAYWALEGHSFEELTSINPSSVIEIGVEIYVPLSKRPGYGERGTLIVWGTNPHMIYQDTAHSGYVGYEFIPTWYDPDYCRYTDWLSVHLHFPNTFYNGTLAYYHYTEPDRYYYDSNTLVYVWEYSSHTPTILQHGISFPYDETYITTYYTAGFEEFWGTWGDIIIIIIIFIFFLTCCIFIGMKTKTSAKAIRLRRTKYLPPAVKVEALGIRRGLTVVEAAILSEVPLQRVFTMIVFGLLKKDLISISRAKTGNKPTFQMKEENIAKAASTRTFHYYERLFLKAISSSGNLYKDKIQAMLKTLIKTTARKLEGYSRADTIVYYQRMMTKAWEEINLATTPEAQASALNEYAEWLLLDPAYEERLQQHTTYYAPTWYYWWVWSSHPHTYPGPRPTLGVPLATPISITNFANVTVLATQNFANTVVTGFQNLANQIATAFRPPPPPPRRSTFSGRSCACACACASCACACAGGGR
jgi:hypothetical protein